jgi:hypothetical protein
MKRLSETTASFAFKKDGIFTNNLVRRLSLVTRRFVAFSFSNPAKIFYLFFMVEIIIITCIFAH